MERFLSAWRTLFWLVGELPLAAAKPRLFKSR